MSFYLPLQKAIEAAISQPHFDAALPPLSDDTWLRILSPSYQTFLENDRLEFLGDALMDATIGRQLYAQIPDGSPHLYTSLRSALHSNATFAHLAKKLDILAVSSPVLKALTRKSFGEGEYAQGSFRIKDTADLFETVVGAYYLECGFEALYDWMKDIYKPLIAVAKQKFIECRRKRYRETGNFGTRTRVLKKHNLTTPPFHAHSSRKPRFSQLPVGSRRYSPSKARAKCGSYGAYGMHNVNVLSSFQPTATRETRSRAPSPLHINDIIDLTLSDSDDDDIARNPAYPTPLPQPIASSSTHAGRAPSVIAIEDDSEDTEDELMLERMLLINPNPEIGKDLIIYN
ncbi:Ribonuclease 3 [Grifola frondosa]|uniref:Ribonuclease 3 n=1 Tax=Grifola frondosa TaxID=5627 RepID=A0A1C7MNY2_GRIFR|nr:Ribonuclease 3 [Grifola frondosa]